MSPCQRERCSPLLMHRRSRKQSCVKTRPPCLRMIPVTAGSEAKSASAAAPSVVESQTRGMKGHSSTARPGHVLGCWYGVAGVVFILHGWYRGPPTPRKGSLFGMESLMPPLIAEMQIVEKKVLCNHRWFIRWSVAILFNRFHPQRGFKCALFPIPVLEFRMMVPIH